MIYFREEGEVNIIEKLEGIIEHIYINNINYNSIYSQYIFILKDLIPPNFIK